MQWEAMAACLSGAGSLPVWFVGVGGVACWPRALSQTRTAARRPDAPSGTNDGAAAVRAVLMAR